ncbi:MAG: hypothetical protein HOP08_08495 [Cyclobacteriaceae bacterium]|nr:hypothetical protein [Cyclobacteriaceae bacterium]
MEIIPSRLLASPTSAIPPPVETLHHELPYDKLSWEDFERLCLKLAQNESHVEFCRPYGVRGDKQEGIDIFARKGNAKMFTVYQCKKVTKFGPAKIAGAVKLFTEGEWLSKTDQFILCTQESFVSKKSTDELIKQKDLLKALGVQLIAWDGHGLNSLLKVQPQIVYDFFGENWTRVFNGNHALSSIIKKGRALKKSFDEPSIYINRKIVLYGDQLAEFLDKGVDLKDLISQEKRIALLGAAQTGKSIELRKLVSELSKESSPYYPFLINLNTYTDKSIKEYIIGINELQQDKIVLCLDGLDEVQSGSFDTVGRKIMEFSEDFPDSIIIVSCRSNFYKTALENLSLNTLRNFKSFRLAQLRENEIEQFLHTKLGDKTDNFLARISDNNLRGLLSIPYYLVKLSEQYANKGKVAGDKAELFEEIIRENLEADCFRHFKQSVDSKISLMYEVLKKLAFLMEFQGKRVCTTAELQKIFNPSELLVLQASGTLFMKSGESDTQWNFINNNIQEYLTAKALSEVSFNKIKEIVSFRPDYKKIKPIWVNSLSFLITILDEKIGARDVLLDWMIQDNLDVIVKFEIEKLDESIRFKAFSKIFQYYKTEDRFINRNIFDPKELAFFSRSERTIDFLLKEGDISQGAISRSTALELLSNYDFRKEFKAKQKQVKELVKKISNIQTNRVCIQQ